MATQLFCAALSENTLVLAAHNLRTAFCHLSSQLFFRQQLSKMLQLCIWVAYRAAGRP